MMFERPDSVHRIERCYRRIGSCADFQPAFQEGTKRVHLRRTLLTESQLIKLPGVSPLRIERRLYRHGQAEHRRALNLIGRGQFAVLDSMPAVSSSMYGEETCAVRAPIDPSSERSPPICVSPRSMTNGMSVEATYGTTSTGRRSRCRINTSRSRAPWLLGSDISCTHVTPRDAARDAASSWKSSRSLSSNPSEYQRWSWSLASRRTTAVGVPESSRSTPARPIA